MALLDDYESPAGFCEVFDADEPRREYAALVARLQSLDGADLEERAAIVDDTFRNLGITFAVYGADEGIERTWPMDLVPRIIAAEEWRTIEAGLIQRVRALNAFLEDLYVGERTAFRDEIIPPWLVTSAEGFVRGAHGIDVVGGVRCVVSGIDIVRDGAGTYRVLEDNLRVPSGISYVLENRAAMRRAFPVVFSQYAVRGVDDYGTVLLRALRDLAPRGVADPTVVVLTPGVYNSAYFEHTFLARSMGVELVEGRDLVVDDHKLYMHTTRGLRQIHVVYRRIDDDFLDPVAFDRNSMLGVPGLMSAVAAGTVTLANAVGNGAADDKGVYPFVPAFIRHYLGEEPILDNVDTYLLWEDEQRADVLGRLDELVVKPVAEAGGTGIVIGPQATGAELDEVRRQVEADPRGFIAQEVVQLSTHPTYVEGGLNPRHLDLRPFVVAGRTIDVVPGGLTRVALPEGSLIVNSSKGGGSKDTWVLES
ncbi:MAG: circularly permuted type 2 ATP-grasp protein [Acidimicrobiia bacterium]|nr:circularly permuted type 2 ATP-grasp protein [Acidimicrobiia bacterium]